MKRIIYRIRYRKLDRAWAVMGKWKRVLEMWDTKPDAIWSACTRARGDWKRGDVAQVMIFKKNGQIQSERTFGRDPVRHKG